MQMISPLLILLLFTYLFNHFTEFYFYLICYSLFNVCISIRVVFYGYDSTGFFHSVENQFYSIDDDIHPRERKKLMINK